MKDPAGNEIFLANDTSLVRLDKKEPLSMCQGLVYSTDYTDLYLTPKIDNRLFIRPLQET